MDHIHKHVSDNSKQCLPVSNFGILSVVVCSASAANTSLCRGLKYLLKVPYNIQKYPNLAGILIFETLCLGRSKTLPYV